MTLTQVDWDDEGKTDNSSNSSSFSRRIDDLEQEFKDEYRTTLQGLGGNSGHSEASFDYFAEPTIPVQRRQSMDDDSLFWAEEDASLHNLGESFTLSDSDPLLLDSNKNDHGRNRGGDLLGDSSSSSNNLFDSLPVMGSGQLPQMSDDDHDDHDSDGKSFDSESSSSSSSSNNSSSSTSRSNNNNSSNSSRNRPEEAMPEWRNEPDDVLPDWNASTTSARKRHKSSRRSPKTIGGNLMSESSQRKSHRLKDRSQTRSARARDRDLPDHSTSSKNNNNNNNNLPSLLPMEGHSSSIKNGPSSSINNDEDDPLYVVDKTPDAIASSQRKGRNNNNKNNNDQEETGPILQVDYEGRNNPEKKRDWNAWWIGMMAICLICILFAAAVILPVYFFILKGDILNEDDNGNNSDSEIDLQPPASAAYIIPLPLYTQQAIENNTSTPQARAYDWLLKDSNLDTYSETRKLQRFALATLYYALEGDQWTTNTTSSWLDYDVSECQWGYRGVRSGFHTNCETTSDINHKNNINNNNSSSINSSNSSSINSSNSSNSSSNSSINNNNNNNNGDSGVTTQQERTSGSSSNIFDKHALLRKRRLQTEVDELFIVDVQIPNNHLLGSLPPELELLSHLRTLDLSYNSIEGEIPTQMASLSQLVHLNLTHNSVEGIIPRLSPSSLKQLGLGHNQFQSTLPFWLGASTMLQQLDLSYNHFTGKLPQEVELLGQSLISLQLQNNQLTGLVPNDLRFLTQLQIFDASSNQLNGTLPTQIGAMVGLEELAFRNNTITGPIPKAIGNLKHLKILRLSDNQLTGAIPEEVGKLGSISLSHFDIHDNKIRGALPDDLCDIQELQFDCGRVCGCNCTCSGSNTTDPIDQEGIDVDATDDDAPTSEEVEETGDEQVETPEGEDTVTANPTNTSLGGNYSTSRIVSDYVAVNATDAGGGIDTSGNGQGRDDVNGTFSAGQGK